MATIPTEMIAEILSRLPVKSLLRFKSVSKSWNSLIKTPNFIKLHLNRTLISYPNSNLHLLIYYPYLYTSEFNSELSFSKLPHPLSPHQVHLFGSCNGVICISDPSKTDVFLFNPLTNSRRKLPFIDYPDLNPKVVLFGFGYDWKKEDYKVLRIVQGFKPGQVLYEEAKVYSFNSKSWKPFEGIIPFYIFEGDCHGVHVNEALHYITLTKTSYNTMANSRGHVLAKFDLRTEVFSFMAFPNYVEKDGFNVMLTLTELGGCLCLMINYIKMLVLEYVDLWVMKEYGKKESWVRIVSVCTESIGSRMQMKPIVYSNDGRRILLEIDTLGFGWYDLESKNLERFTPHGLPDANIEVAKFVDSLVLLDDEMHCESETLPKKIKKKNSVDNFLSKGFKLRL